MRALIDRGRSMKPQLYYPLSISALLALPGPLSNPGLNLHF
jgi:hypothetical protein